MYEKHGHRIRESREYITWKSMKARCYQKSCTIYKYYGGRGITVCERWKNSFPSFYEDMGKKPSPKHSLDRIDVNGDYTPENCRWATHTQQARNRSNTVLIEVDGEVMTIYDLIEKHNIKVVNGSDKNNNLYVYLNRHITGKR